MAASLLLLLPLVALAVTAVVVLVVLAAHTVGREELPGSTARAHEHAVRGGVLAVVAAGVVAAVAAVELGRLRTPVPGQALTVVPALAALAHLAVLALTERTWPRPINAVRSARLAPRGVQTVTPRALARALGGAAGALLVTVAVAGLLAAPDGRSISTSDARHSSTAGPFPGLPYGLPALLAVAVLLGVSLLVLRLVVARPAVEEADDATDLALRRAGAHRVLRGALAATLLTLGPLLFFAGTAAGNVHEGPARAAAVVVAAVGALAALAGLLTLAVPAPQVPAPRRSDPAALPS